jgi:hypothetical protein
LAWYQRNYFSNINQNEKWIHSYCEVDGKNYRVYDTNRDDYSNEGVFWNEVGVFFEKIIDQDLKVFYFSTKPKLKTILTEEDFLFFKNYKNYYGYSEIPKNLKWIRDMQAEDLQIILNGLLMETFIVVSKITNNSYHYELLAGVKMDFNLEKFLKINFNIINIVNVNQIFKNDLNYDFIIKIFDFDLIKKFYSIFEKDFSKYMENTNSIKTEESTNLEEYRTYKYKTDNNWNSNTDAYFCWLFNESMAKRSEIFDENFYLKHFFKNFGFYWYVLNYNFKDAIFDKNLNKDVYTEPTYQFNDTFILCLKPASQLIVLKNIQNGELELYKEIYDYWCFYDWLDSMKMESDYSVGMVEISVPKLKSGSAYKPRLNKNNSK